MNAFNADDFLKRLADYLTSVYRISGTLKNDLISAARQVVYLYQNIPMDRLKAGCSEVVDQLYDALESNVHKKGIAELLLDDDYYLTGDELRKAYNTYKSAYFGDEANGIDYKTVSVGNGVSSQFRTTIDIYRYGICVSYIDLYTDRRPDNLDKGKFFDGVAELINQAGDEVPVESYIAIKSTLDLIAEREREHILKK